MNVTSIGSSLVTQLDVSREFQRDLTTQKRSEPVKVFDSPLPAAGFDAKPQVLNSTAEDLERISLVFDKKLQFVVDHRSKEVIVKVIDRETDKVIKELPPEELQRLHRNLKDTIGLLFDTRV